MSRKTTGNASGPSRSACLRAGRESVDVEQRVGLTDRGGAPGRGSEGGQAGGRSRKRRELAGTPVCGRDTRKRRATTE
eukprot:2972282-Rhodomonas_salina.1